MHVFGQKNHMDFVNKDHENIKCNVDRTTALELTQVNASALFDLLNLALAVRVKYRGNKVDLCSIINAKSGTCPEDCAFCAQSVQNKTDIKEYTLKGKEEMLRAAITAKQRGVKRFCVVTSGRKASASEIDQICSVISDIKTIGLSPCATLGIITESEIKALKDAGLERYHHNLETSESFFREICTTHTYTEKVKTIQAAQSAGLSVCSGGIFGLGESWKDRIDMAFALRELKIDSVPVNFLTPIHGTPLESRETLNPLEALKLIAIYRLILPDCEIRICGGRPNTLRDLNAFIFTAGADGLLIGNYLTTQGRNPDDDLQMIKDLGLEI
jgi:biotin synthase